MDLEQLIEQNKKFNVKFFRVTVGDTKVSVNIDSELKTTAAVNIPEDVLIKIKENPELINFIRKYNNKED